MSASDEITTAPAATVPRVGPARRSRTSRYLLRGSLGVLAAALVGGGWYASTILLLGSGYVAQTMCTSLFVTGFDRNRAWNTDVIGRNNVLLGLFRVQIDTERRRVTAAPFGGPLLVREAVFREGLGCALTIRRDPDAMQAVRIAMPAGPAPRGLWPDGETVTAPEPRVQAAVDAAFAASAKVPEDRLRAIVVVRGGRIIAERMAPGITAGTPLPGWSMSKTISNSLAGIAVGRGLIGLDSRALLPAWRSPRDPRSRITFGSLLFMTEGSAFREGYTPTSDTPKMLYGVPDAVAYYAGFPLAEPVGSSWDYSTGSIVAALGALRQTMPDADYMTFPRTALFGPLGMRTAVMDTDPAGNLMGGSGVYASPHDWARFGLFLLRGGVWNGKRLLPAAWAKMMTEPVPHSGGKYAKGNVWLRRDPAALGLPKDVFFVNGHDGQMIAVVPSLDLAIVRLGMTNPQDLFDPDALTRSIVAALPPEHNAAGQQPGISGRATPAAAAGKLR